MEKKIDSAEYFKSFAGPSTKDGKASVALEKALEIRKFEIEHYWKRATYFWTFTAAAFTGYFAVLATDNDVERVVLFAISCLGLVFSLTWYFVNRGSKYWQLNWEEHVDLLENEFMGPLYKTVIDRDRFFLDDFLGPYPFSVSKLNTILSMFVTFVWAFLWVRTLSMGLGGPTIGPRTLLVILAFATVICLFSLYENGRTGDPVPVYEESDAIAAARRARQDKYQFTQRDAPGPLPQARDASPSETESKTPPRAET